MALPNVFDKSVNDAIINRLEKLSPETLPKWGKMNASQMLAHLNVPYDLTYDRIPVKYNFFMKLMLKYFVKDYIVNEKPYKHNLQTAPVFIIADERNFENEKNKLIENIRFTESKGENYFNGKENVSFGKLTTNEWNNMFIKHIEHHFTQFGI